MTADGSISCADEPDKQEMVIGQLLYCEVVAALVNLVRGGSFVVKMFTMFEHHTVSILYLLCSLFDEVEMIKPGSSLIFGVGDTMVNVCFQELLVNNSFFTSGTSKPGNSEVYCVCTCFAGPECLSKDLMEKLQTHYTSFAPKQALFSQESLPTNFLEKVLTCAKTFSEFQTDAINKNIELFEKSSKGKWKFLNQLRNHLAEEFINRFNIQCLQQECCVVPHVHLDGTQLSYWPESSKDTFCNSGTHERGSYVERVEMSKLGWHERVVLQHDEMSPFISEDVYVNEILDSGSGAHQYFLSQVALRDAKRDQTGAQHFMNKLR